MLNHNSAHLALRALLRTLSVATTGSTSLSATATGYNRASGSFVTDGFYPGMEITPSGFATNIEDTITAVTATDITTLNSKTVETAASGRTIACLIPTQFAYENIELDPVIGSPYIEEQYIPGPASLDSLGSQGDMTCEPMYVINLYTPENVGISASNAYSDAILTLFAPGTSITAGSDTVFVRADPAPYKGQRLNRIPGFTIVTITIPLRCYTSNA